jgi:hypothetical protein
MLPLFASILLPLLLLLLSMWLPQLIWFCSRCCCRCFQAAPTAPTVIVHYAIAAFGPAAIVTGGFAPMQLRSTPHTLTVMAEPLHDPGTWGFGRRFRGLVERAGPANWGRLLRKYARRYGDRVFWEGVAYRWSISSCRMALVGPMPKGKAKVSKSVS